MVRRSRKGSRKGDSQDSQNKPASVAARAAATPAEHNSVAAVHISNVYARNGFSIARKSNVFMDNSIARDDIRFSCLHIGLSIARNSIAEADIRVARDGIPIVIDDNRNARVRIFRLPDHPRRVRSRF